jgi:hypothetical protein
MPAMIRRFLLGALLLGSLPALSQGQTTVVEYYHLDALGTVRAVTDQAGAVVERHDYLPHGEAWCGTAVCSSPTQGQPLRFTGKERDAETGLDYFGTTSPTGQASALVRVSPSHRRPGSMRPTGRGTEVCCDRIAADASSFRRRGA